MYFLRSCKTTDIEGLLGLAQKSNLLNLPPDKEGLKARVDRSIESFGGKISNPQNASYIFVLEDPEGTIAGTSAVIGQHGTKENPHVSLAVLEEEKYSPVLDKHFKHQVLKLSFNYEGPTEVGGIILDPQHRGKGQHLGKLLSYSRFLYMALKPERFRKHVIAEMLPPEASNNSSPLWEALGKHFTGLSYVEASQATEEHKDFIHRLFPHEPVYTCLLPLEAQQIIGATASETQPALALLKSIGFEYMNCVDPFDGGPHYIAERENISLIKKTTEVAIERSGSSSQAEGNLFLVGAESKRGEFVSTVIDAHLEASTLYCQKEAFELLNQYNAKGVALPLSST